MLLQKVDACSNTSLFEPNGFKGTKGIPVVKFSAPGEPKKFNAFGGLWDRKSVTYIQN